MRRKGFAAVAQLAVRPKDRRGRPPSPPDSLDRSAPDALALWLESYLDYLASRNYSPDTTQARRENIHLFLLWAAERDLSRASQVTRPILEAYQRALWLHRKPNGQPLGWGTQHSRLMALKDFFRWLTRQNVLLHNPASELELPRREKRLPHQVLTPAQVEQLLAVPDLQDALGVRDRALLELLYSTGIRRIELCRLERADFHAERHTLHVRGKGNKDRMVPVGARARQWLERYLQEVRPRLCLDAQVQALFLTAYGEAFNPDVLSHMVCVWLRQSGLPRKGGCHLLRHACATHMLENGADIRFIQQLLGHARLETTAIYTEVSIKQLQEVHTRCHPSARLPEAAKGASTGTDDLAHSAP